MLNAYVTDPKRQAQGCVIWMHGLGADASDMAGLAEQLMVNDIALRHVFVDAPVRPITMNGGMAMRAWYDINNLDLNAREDKEGIIESQHEMLSVIKSQIEEGFTANQVFLAGFSQGGAMAFHTALHFPHALAGVISLSAYLPLARECKPVLPQQTPMFIAHGSYDPLVLPNWTNASIQYLKSNGYQEIEAHEYPMEHSVCLAEIADLSKWLIRQFQGEIK